MSRIGRKPIPVPAAVKVQIGSATIEVQGPKGKLSIRVPRGIHFEQKDGTLVALRESEEVRALHGLPDAEGYRPARGGLAASARPCTDARAIAGSLPGRRRRESNGGIGRTARTNSYRAGEFRCRRTLHRFAPPVRKCRTHNGSSGSRQNPDEERAPGSGVFS